MSRGEKSLVVVEIDSLEGMGQARLSQLTNDELRKLCAERGLDTTGIKADLVSRIMYWKRKTSGVKIGEDSSPQKVVLALSSPSKTSNFSQSLSNFPSPLAQQTASIQPFSFDGVTWMSTEGAQRDASSFASQYYGILNRDAETILKFGFFYPTALISLVQIIDGKTEIDVSFQGATQLIEYSKRYEVQFMPNTVIGATNDYGGLYVLVKGNWMRQSIPSGFFEQIFIMVKSKENSLCISKSQLRVLK